MTERESKRIGPFPNNFNGRKRFMQGLIEAGSEGFTLPVERFNVDACMQFGAALRIQLYKEATSESLDNPVVEPSAVAPVDRLGDLEKGILSASKLKKDDMLWFASEKGIEVPEELKLPLQIRKYLKEILESKD